MKTTFDCIYFNGKSSKANKAILTLENNSWRITAIDASFEDKTWHLDKIIKPEVYTSGFYAYSYGDIPREILQITDSKIEKSIESQYPRYNLTRKSDSFLINNKLKSIVILSILFVGIALLSYFIVIPQLSNAFVNSLPANTVEKSGTILFQKMENELEINKELSLLVQNFVDELVYESEFTMKVKVSNKETVNAFAMPGGNIVIYKGLLEKLENENQLLALLGHEFTHTTERHVLKNLVTNLSGYFIISLATSDVNGILAIVFENAHLLNQLSFSRELEKEADIYGINFVKENKADPNGMHELFTIMNDIEVFQDIPYFDYLSTHPNMEGRIEYSKKIAETIQVRKNKKLALKWKEIEFLLN